MSKKILTFAPKKYLEQGLGHCGAFSVKAIMSAYNKDIHKDPRAYHPHVFGKYSFLTNGCKVWPIVLTKHGVPAIYKNARDLTNKQRITLLKKLLNKNKPVMLRIGNGYLKNGKYSPFIASFMGHWITLWGYNDKEKIFYVYDSYVATKRHNKDIPIGNTIRTYEETLRDWKRGFPWKWRWSYIEIK